MTEFEGKSAGPLAGVRIVELSGIGPGRYGGMLLAELGAEVVLVERPGQEARRADSVVGRGRRSIMLNLKDPAGVETLMRLVDQADVFVEPYRPGVAEKLGIGPAEVQGRNPKIVYGRMTGWGQDGPLAKSAGHDIGYIAITGVLNAIGRNGGPPQVPLNLVGDFGGGTMFLALGIVSALLERERTGKGRVVDASIVDGTLSLASFILGLRSEDQWSDERGTNLLDTGAPYYDVYETSDGLYMAVGAIEPQFFALLVKLLELDPASLPAQDDRERWEELRSAFTTRFKEKTRDEWAAIFDGTDACVAPVLSFEEAPNHPHIAARRSLFDRDGVLLAAPAPRFDGEVLESAPPAGSPGGETRKVLEDWGITDVDGLLASGAAVQPES